MDDIETFEEFCNINNCSTCRFEKNAIDAGCSNCEKLFMKEHDKQIRADVIDEFLAKAKERKYHSKTTYENAVAIAELDWIAEEMKLLADGWLPYPFE